MSGSFGKLAGRGYSTRGETAPWVDGVDAQGNGYSALRATLPELVTCGKCRGSGVWSTGPYSNNPGQRVTCSVCRGAGKVRPAPSTVAKLERIATNNKDAVEAWKAEHPAAWAWLDNHRGDGGFGQSVHHALHLYGRLTPNQLTAVHRAIDRDTTRAAAIATTQRPAASMPAVEAAFAKATAAGIKYPKMRLAGFTMSPASASSPNAGAIYVKDDKGTYMGKVMAGRFSRSRDCTPELEQRVLQVAADPKAAAIAYGKEYGHCAICGRELSDAESVERGIGPICAERYGWA